MFSRGDRSTLPLVVLQDVPKPLLPVANRPLLSYTLDLLEACSLRSVLIVSLAWVRLLLPPPNPLISSFCLRNAQAVSGESLALQMNSWITETYGDRLKAEVIAVAEEAGSADALREVVHRVSADDLLVLSGDVIADSSLSLGSLAAAHRRHGGVATVLLHPRPAIGPTDTKTAMLDCCAIDASATTLLAFTSGT